MTYEEAVNYLNQTARFAKKTSLDNVRYFMKCLGDPQDHLRFIHTAGTNGKGSVCAFMEAFLIEKGWKVGVFSSPHVMVINERIRLESQMADNEEFSWACEKVYRVVENGKKKGKDHPSFFEFLFLMALLIFQKRNLDFCIIETGMGGRYDATNLIDPELCVITTISMDHMEFLGSTIAEIASHKAGIIKEGKKVLCARQQEEAKCVICKEAEKKHASLEIVSEDNLKFHEKLGKYIDFLNSNAYDKKRVVGDFQMENMALAIRAVEWISGALSDDMIQRGLRHLVLPGRMEEVLPGIYVDVAHNEQGIEAFCHTVEKYFAGKKRILFAASHKNEEETMRKALDSLSSVERFCHLNIDGRRIDEKEFAAAFQQLIEDRDDDTVCFIVGSFYLAGITKNYMIQEEVKC